MGHLIPRSCATICPLCGAGELRPHGEFPVRCRYCDRVLERSIIATLEQIVSLPEARGGHACECGHPEMRLLPDGIFHCPACGSEVVPAGGSSELSGPGIPGEAYRCGWADGFFGGTRRRPYNRGLARWTDARDRLDYRMGHRAGRAARWDERPGDRAAEEAA